MPNNKLKSRERKVVKIAHGSYKSPHPTGGGHVTVCRGTISVGWAGKGPHRSLRSRYGVLPAPWFSAQAILPISHQTGKAGPWFGLCGLPSSSPFLRTRNHSNFRQVTVEAASLFYEAAMVPFHLRGDPGRHMLTSLPVCNGEQDTESSNNPLVTTQQLSGRVN